MSLVKPFVFEGGLRPLDPPRLQRLYLTKIQFVKVFVGMEQIKMNLQVLETRHISFVSWEIPSAAPRVKAKVGYLLGEI